MGIPLRFTSLGSGQNALDEARQTVAHSLHARPEEIVFTGGGTESDNLAVRGMALLQREARRATHLLISPVEHPAVLSTARQLAEHYGYELEFLCVDEYGQVHPDDVKAQIRPDTAVVSVMYANNEIGTINPIAEIAAVCLEKGVPFHTDAVQAAAHLPMDVRRDRVSSLALGAHKFYGPKGVGALYLRGGDVIPPTQTGGKQEFGLRAGTQNVPYIVGLAEALRITRELEPRGSKLLPLRDRLIEGVLETIPRAKLTGHPRQRLPNHSLFCVRRGRRQQAADAVGTWAGFAVLQVGLQGGGAAAFGGVTGYWAAAAWALGSLRVTLGRDSNAEQIERFLAVLPASGRAGAPLK